MRSHCGFLYCVSIIFIMSKLETFIFRNYLSDSENFQRWFNEKNLDRNFDAFKKQTMYKCWRCAKCHKRKLAFDITGIGRRSTDSMECWKLSSHFECFNCSFFKSCVGIFLQNILTTISVNIHLSRFSFLWFLLFPNLKIALEKEVISQFWED